MIVLLYFRSSCFNIVPVSLIRMAFFWATGYTKGPADKVV